MAVLVTGGAGYIGSHAVKRLLGLGHKVYVLDNLSTGHQWAIDSRAHFVEGTTSDFELTANLLKTEKIESILHFAALSIVPDSVRDPLLYFDNNNIGMLRLLQAASKSQVKNFILSSTASVYGEPEVEISNKIPETAQKNPINSYGNTKLAAENLLADFAKSPSAPKNFKYSILRYFNVAGASLDQSLGQASKIPTHLVKIASLVACGVRPYLDIFGQDYSTPDGTCVRDYIHVEDLVTAHTDVLEYLRKGGKSDIFNCGYGIGYSILQVIEAMKRAAQINFETKISPRRPGDPAILVADSSKIKSVVGWKPKFNDIELICRTAYEWEMIYQKKLNEH